MRHASTNHPPPNDHYDLVVIGSGPGGQRAAVQAAKLKKRVLVIEKERVGGACLHRGTIPSKTMREAALEMETQTEHTMHSIMVRMRKVIDAEAGVVAQQLKRNGVEYAQGCGSFLNAKTVAIDGGKRKVTGDFIVIATGTSPNHPGTIPFNSSSVFDSDTILEIKHQPKKLVVVGAGVIGCEYASIFARMGTKVTLVNRPEGILRGVDQEIVEELLNHFTDKGIDVRTSCHFSDITIKGNSVHIQLDAQDHTFDAALYCLGRSGNVGQLNLAAAGLGPDERGLLTVNEFYQTAAPHIYAVGDVIGQPALAASSAEQGRLAAAHAFGLLGGKFPSSFPYGIYTIPEISWTGKQEQELIDAEIPYVVGRALYAELARGKIIGDDHGFLKLLVHRETRRILGVHILGTGATELIHIGQIAMDMGASIELIVNNVFNYPTLAEAYKVAAYNAYNQLYLTPAAAPAVPDAAPVVPAAGTGRR